MNANRQQQGGGGGNVQRFDPLSNSNVSSAGSFRYGAAAPSPPVRGSYVQQQQHQPSYRQPPPPPQYPQAPPPPPQAQPPQITAEQLYFLQNQGFPTGLIQAILPLKQVFPLRIWILDNSQSMNVQDAHVLKPDYQQANVTRWQELLDCVKYHADFYTLFGMPTRFALLNAPPTNLAAPQYFSLLQTGNLAQEQQVMGQVLRTVQPNGPTPLTTQLNILHQYIASLDAGLRARGHTFSIVLTTQGLPTNEKGESSPQIVSEFVQALRKLESFSVWIVLRLCSDDEKTFEFYNSLDTQDNLDVLDDFCGEALEVYLRNPWLCYAIVLHRFRETGFRHGTLDAIDERALTVAEIRDLCQFLLGVTLPDPTRDWNGFLRALEACMARQRPHWNPIFKTVTPWVNLRLLHAIYGRPRASSSTSTPPTGGKGPTSSSPMRPPPTTPMQQPQHAPQSTSSASTTPPPPSAPSGTSPGTPQAPSTSSTQDLTQSIEKSWSKEPPMFTQSKGISVLLGSMHVTFDLVEPHEYFSKFHSFTQDALNGNDMAVLKRAVRKTRLFLHPDKLPKDLNEHQQTLCRVLWDTISEAWNLQQEKSDGATSK